MSLLVQEPPRKITDYTSTSVIYDIRGSSDYDRPKLPCSIRINFNTPISQIINKVNDLRTWPEGWNGGDVAAPKFKAIDHANSWVHEMYTDVALSPKGWQEPHVTASEDGDVMLEWWNKEKGLTVYISENEVSYIKDWGADILGEMEDGTISTSEDRRLLWAWLVD